MKTAGELRLDAADRPRAEEAVRAIYYHSGRAGEIECLWFESLPAMRLGYATLSMAPEETLRAAERDAALPAPVLAGLRHRTESGRTPVGAPWSLKEAFDGPLARLARACAGPMAGAASRAPLLARCAPELAALRVDPALAERAWACRAALDEGPQGPGARLLAAYLTAAESCLWWCPFERVALLCERPCAAEWRGGSLGLAWRDGALTHLRRPPASGRALLAPCRAMRHNRARKALRPRSPVAARAGRRPRPARSPAVGQVAQL